MQANLAAVDELLTKAFANIIELNAQYSSFAFKSKEYYGDRHLYNDNIKFKNSLENKTQKFRKYKLA